MKELILIDSVLHATEIYDDDNLSDHIYFLADWVLWNRINQSINSGRFNVTTKIFADTLVSRGAKSSFIQALANGNPLFPKDVIDAALMAENMDRWRKERGK